MSSQVQFYHVILNIAWMQANQSRKFLFAGICGCPNSVEGDGGIIINTQPNGKCQFCGKQVEMRQLYALTSKSQWLELYKAKEGQFATRTPDFAPGTEGTSPTSTLAVSPSD